MHLNLPSGLILEHRGRHRASTTTDVVHSRHARQSSHNHSGQCTISIEVKSSQVKGRLWRGGRGFKSSLYINNRQQTTLDLT